VWAERRWIRRAFATSDRISLLMERGLAGLILQLYELAYIERWNDHPKPFHITELDKQAHKATIAYVVGRFEEHLRGVSLDWDYLIRGLIFEALQRSVLTDIKPQIFHRLLRERSGELSAFVLEELRDDMEGFSADLRGRFERYLKGEDVKERERRIIRASHFLATYWEFQMIYSTGLKFYGIERVKEEIEDTIEEFFDLVGVERIYLRKKTFNFVDLVGQLRFQKRWIQSPRLPTTTVLGHMFIVASLSYLLSFRAGVCERRRFLNFFSGLFHDLPEVTTRDIVAPIKRKAGIGRSTRGSRWRGSSCRCCPTSSGRSSPTSSALRTGRLTSSRTGYGRRDARSAWRGWAGKSAGIPLTGRSSEPVTTRELTWKLNSPSTTV